MKKEKVCLTCCRTAKLCYDIPPFRHRYEVAICFDAGTWNRRNNSRNNGSTSSRSDVAIGRWNDVSALTFGI